MGSTLKKLGEIKGVRGVSYRLGHLREQSSFAIRSAAYFAKLGLQRNGGRPEVTAVVVGRNDDYMADFGARLTATIEWNLRYLVSEVIFVEWNPLPDRALLAYELTRRFPAVRVYVVPPEIHHHINRNPNLQMLEYHAKNVGIRRVRTPWVLTTNADAALGTDTVNIILNANLDPDVVWTAERVDIAWRENSQQHIGFFGSMRKRRVIPYESLGTGEFALASKQLWDRARGYDEALVRHKIGCDVRGVAQMLAHGGRINRAGTVLHLQHPSSCVEGIRPFHGELATIEGVPYRNNDDWGLGSAREVQLADRVWQLSME